MSVEIRKPVLDGGLQSPSVGIDVVHQLPHVAPHDGRGLTSTIIIISDS